MLFRITYYVISLIIFAGCSTGPDFDRDNENDPESKIYSPNPPSGEHYELDEEGNVTLFWEDNTDFETGYFLYKSLGSNSTFELLTELDKNSTQFYDSSKALAFPTTYHIVSVSDSQASDTTDVSIDFGRINGFSSEILDSRIKLTWDDQVSFEDGFHIKRKSDSQSDTVHVTSTGDDIGNFLLDIPNDGFEQQFFIYPFKVYEQDTTLLEESSLTVNSGGPDNLSISVNAVDSLLITWENHTNFEDNFELTIKKNSSEISNYTVSKGVDSYKVLAEFGLEDTFEAWLSAKYDDVKSPTIHSDVLNINEIISPSIDSVVTIDETTANLFIYEHSNISRDIEILRSTNGGSYLSVGVLTKGETVFTDTNLNSENNYSYILRTFLTKDTDPYSIYYKPSLKLKRNKYFTANWLYSFEYSKSTNSLIYLSGISEIQADNIHFYNLDTHTDRKISSPTKYLEYLKINKNGDLLAAYDWRGNSDKIFIYDLSSERPTSETITIENLDYARDIVFTPNSNAMYISAQVEDPDTRQIAHEIIYYDLVQHSYKTVFYEPHSYFYTNYSSDQLLMYSISGFGSSPTTFSLNRYQFYNDSLRLYNNCSFTSDLIRNGSQVVTSSPEMNTVVFSSNYHDHLNGVVRLNLNTGQVIDRTKIHVNGYDRPITGLYYSQRYTLAQYDDGIFIIEHIPDGYQIVDYYQYQSGYQFKDDFLYINDKNILIDARSSYGNEEYLESNFWTFQIFPKWKQVVDIK